MNYIYSIFFTSLLIPTIALSQNQSNWIWSEDVTSFLNENNCKKYKKFRNNLNSAFKKYKQDLKSPKNQEKFKNAYLSNDPMIILGKLFWPIELPSQIAGRNVYLSCHSHAVVIFRKLHRKQKDSAKTDYNNWIFCLEDNYKQQIPHIVMKAMRCIGKFVEDYRFFEDGEISKAKAYSRR